MVDMGRDGILGLEDPQGDLKVAYLGFSLRGAPGELVDEREADAVTIGNTVLSHAVIDSNTETCQH